MNKESELDSQIIETQDEFGKTIRFELLDILDIDDNEYALLYPISEEKMNSDDENDEEEEAVIMRLIQDGEEYIFERIDDDAEFEKVEQYINDLKDAL